MSKDNTTAIESCGNRKLDSVVKFGGAGYTTTIASIDQAENQVGPNASGFPWRKDSSELELLQEKIRNIGQGTIFRRRLSTLPN